jgi:DNA-binding NtrC family response regulator
LLLGPRGCGREWLARTIHRLSPRRNEFFARLDAQIVPPGVLADLLLQSTTRFNFGAILLRQPGHLRPEIQVRLAELLADDCFGPRLFVCALDDADVSQLTPPLLAQVGALTIPLRPLRDRRADWPRLIPPILVRAGALAKKASLMLSAEADQALRLHDWPENFRELLSVLRTAALHATSERIELADLPFAFRGAPPPREPKMPLDDLLQNAERRLLLLALEQTGYNKSKAAQLLGIWRARLLRRMEQLGIADAEPAGDRADA